MVSSISGLVLLTIAVAAGAKDYVRVCYYSNWSQYRIRQAKFLPENIDPYLCTHLVYAFSKINDKNEMTTFEWNDDQLYKRFNALKKQNTDLVTLLAVGGWNHEGGVVSPFSRMAASAASRKVFVKSVVTMLRKFDFDGLDLDWEYPANRGNSPAKDRERFTILCQEILDAFKKEAAKSGKKRLLLTAAVSAGKKTIDKAYEVEKIAQILDFISLMAYDLHGKWDNATGHHSALVGLPGDPLTVTFATKYWIDKGMPPNKMVLGLPTYGRSLKLTDPKKHGLGAPARGNPKAGKFTQEAGFLAHYEICKLTLNVVKKNVVKAPYGYQGNQWVSFDDEHSLNLKVDRIIKKKGLRGAMFWSLPLDDFKGAFCNKGKYPLISHVTKRLGGSLKASYIKIDPVPASQWSKKKISNEATPAVPLNAKSGKRKCAAVAPWTKKKTMDMWCIRNCGAGFCPAAFCKCA